MSNTVFLVDNKMISTKEIKEHLSIIDHQIISFDDGGSSMFALKT